MFHINTKRNREVALHSVHHFDTDITNIIKCDDFIIIVSDSSIKVLAPHILDKPFPGTYIISYKHTSPIVFATDILANSSFALHAFGRKIPNQLPNETQVLIFDRSKTFHLIDGARGFVTHSFAINDVGNIIGIAGSRKHTNEFAVLTDTYVYIYQMTLDGCAEIDAQPIYGVSI